MALLIDSVNDKRELVQRALSADVKIEVLFL